MASLPPQHPTQRRTSPEQLPPESSHSQSTTQEQLGGSSDSATAEESVPTTDTSSKASDKTMAARPAPQRQDTDLKKCWICFADESEDTPETSEWRSPCPCALVAHEECLLDWIADMESPSSRKRSIAPPKLLCPQCKSEIHLARPWNPLVELVKGVDRISTKITAPAALLAAMSTITHAFTVHGIHSIFAIFGQDDALRILHPYLNPRRFHEVWDVRESIRELTEHWRLHVGLPLITPMLILSRASIADSILPVLPIVFFATQGDALEKPGDVLHWPPSASMTLAALPYVRSTYNAYYKRVWGHHMQRWAREIQPRQTSSEEGQNNDAAAANQNDRGQQPQEEEEEGIFEIRVDGNLWDDWNGDDNDEPPQPQPQAQQQNAVAPERRDDRQAAEALVEVPGQAAQEPAQQPAQQQDRALFQGERRLSISTSGLAERVLGALLFPTIAGLSGELLRICLPRSWTTGSTWSFSAAGGFRAGGQGGFLSRKWGRSIVGGCLFVVLKDAVMIYVRWKMAQQHRKRRVLDFDRRKKRVVG
ncbi:hypothetical protein K461DRAFT_253872 [Myriangium duriaei CBS 260.36]|uniref:RING-CH-type domain-containing protein n=1 Tax=Myriangium duriaei CBS 260.36 TaxID=1168546 RepID=A0A9P4J1J2_9PEZI|nr:hypothetical protein K461DRAFT_253872 [Myriangium duriaei CBS 260.36]